MEPLLPKHEDDLVVACQRGDAEAAGELVDLFWQRVYAFSYRLTLNGTDAEDITQETFLRALSKIQSYKSEERFKSWLFRIATNLYIDQKKASRNKDVSSQDLGQFTPAAKGLDPQQSLDQKELLSALQTVIKTLTKEQQVVLLLRAIEHLDYPEIAAILETKESTARWHMYEARRILRQQLSKQFDLEAFADE